MESIQIFLKQRENVKNLQWIEPLGGKIAPRVSLFKPVELNISSPNFSKKDS